MSATNPTISHLPLVITCGKSALIGIAHKKYTAASKKGSCDFVANRFEA